MIKKVLNFIIDRPLIIYLFLIFVLLSAVISVFRIQRLAYPRVDMNALQITTVYPGASPEDVELNVTVKLEEAIKEVGGIEKYISSSLENLSKITVFIDPDAEDKEKIKTDIRRSIESVSDLPDEVDDKPWIEEEKMDEIPVYEVAVSIPNLNNDLLYYHTKALKKKLLELDDVSRIDEDGIRDKEIKILLNRNKLIQNAIAFDEVITAIKQNKIRMSGGSLESYTDEKGIVTFSEFSEPKDIENIIIRSAGIGGKKLRIKDVGIVKEDFKKEHVINKYNGKLGYSLWIKKKPKSDVIRTVNGIKKVVDEYKNDNSDDNLKFFSTWDASIETKNRLNILYINAILGFIFVLTVLFLFLDVKIAFWTAFGIPFSIAGTIIMLPFLGISINSISILGLVVVLGMVVDDAIIISESIYRERESGLSAKDASIQGLRIVIKPVIATIITTIIAFIPLYFLPGIVGDFTTEIPSMVILMLTISFIEAAVMLPAHLAHGKLSKRWIPPGQRFINWFKDIYGNILNFCLNHKFLTIIFLFLFLAAGVTFTIFFTKYNMFPEDQASVIYINGETSPKSNLDNTERATRELEKLINQIDKSVIFSYKTTIGYKYDIASSSLLYASNFFSIKLTLTPATKRKMKAKDVKSILKKDSQNIKLIKLLDFYIETGGPGTGKPIEIRVIGNNNEKREKLINKIISDLRNIEGNPISETDNDLKKGKEEIRIIPNYDLIANANLSVAVIASTIRTAFDGAVVTHLRTPEDNIPFRVMLDEESKNFNDPLDGLFVRNQYGTFIKIKSLVYETKGYSPQNIYHYNGERTNTISANIDKTKKTPKELFEMLSKKYADFEKENPGFKVVLGGEAKESSKTFFQLIFLFSLAIIAIYFILVIQFNDFIQPLMVILSIPFGLIGITVAFGLHRMDLSLLSMIGIIGFTGVVVNDSLIMVFFINKLRKEKGDNLLSFNNAVIEGAKTRLRPIILTTLTTVAALFPTAYGLLGIKNNFISLTGGFDAFVSPMVMAMMWGLMIGTTSTLIVIPVLYSVYAGVMNFFKQLFSGNNEEG